MMRAPSLGDHQRPHVLDAEEGARQVGFQHQMPGFLGHVGQGRRETGGQDAGVVDEDVDATERLGDPIDRVLHLPGAADVRSHDERANARHRLAVTSAPAMSR